MFKNIAKKVWGILCSFAVGIVRLTVTLALVLATAVVWFGAICLPMMAFQHGHPFVGVALIPVAFLIMAAGALAYQLLMSIVNPDWPGEIDATLVF